MQNGSQRIDLKKLAIYLLKRSWLIILCAIIGFVGMYWYTAYYQRDTYTAFATCYVLNGNPNLVNYQYTNANDLNHRELYREHAVHEFRFRYGRAADQQHDSQQTAFSGYLQRSCGRRTG